MLAPHPLPRRTPDNLRWREESPPERVHRLRTLRQLDDLLYQVEERNEAGYAHQDALLLHRLALRRLGGHSHQGCTSAQLAASIIDFQELYLREQVQGPQVPSPILLATEGGLL